MTDSRRKISPEQRHQLVQIYLHMGIAESRRACVEAGVHKNYARRAIDAIHEVEVRRTSRDGPKWKRAIERGAVWA